MARVGMVGRGMGGDVDEEYSKQQQSFWVSFLHLWKRNSKPAPILIIPIIMAHYENLINNTEDIVVAISHMAVGLYSVTISPLASTYVCQNRASVTSSSCAHLAPPK